jgi:HEPN domain-containing protein
MLTRSELRRIARTRFQDAETLFRGRRYDGAIYLCGYAVELTLKARVCRTLRWAAFPQTNNEFQQLQSFKTHNLETLLRLAGREDKVRIRHLADWSVVVNWNPESRYEPPGTATRVSALSMIGATRRLMSAI